MQCAALVCEAWHFREFRSDNAKLAEPTLVIVRATPRGLKSRLLASIPAAGAIECLLHLATSHFVVTEPRLTCKYRVAAGIVNDSKKRCPNHQQRLTDRPNPWLIRARVPRSGLKFQLRTLVWPALKSKLLRRSRGYALRTGSRLCCWSRCKSSSDPRA